MNETWIGPVWWPSPPPPPLWGWVDMEAEALRDVPVFMDGGREGEGMLAQVIAQGQKVFETQPPIGQSRSDAVMIPVPVRIPHDGYRTGLVSFYAAACSS